MTKENNATQKASLIHDAFLKYNQRYDAQKHKTANMRNSMFVNVPYAIISPIIYIAPYIFVEYSHSRIVSLDSIHIQAAKMERNKEYLIFLLCYGI